MNSKKLITVTTASKEGGRIYSPKSFSERLGYDFATGVVVPITNDPVITSQNRGYFWQRKCESLIVLPAPVGWSLLNRVSFWLDVEYPLDQAKMNWRISIPQSCLKSDEFKSATRVVLICAILEGTEHKFMSIFPPSQMLLVWTFLLSEMYDSTISSDPLKAEAELVKFLRFAKASSKVEWQRLAELYKGFINEQPGGVHYRKHVMKKSRIIEQFLDYLEKIGVSSRKRDQGGYIVVDLSSNHAQAETRNTEMMKGDDTCTLRHKKLNGRDVILTNLLMEYPVLELAIFNFPCDNQGRFLRHLALNDCVVPALQIKRKLWNAEYRANLREIAQFVKASRVISERMLSEEYRSIK